MILDSRTLIKNKIDSKTGGKGIEHAVCNLKRDMEMVLLAVPVQPDDVHGNIILTKAQLEAEQYRLEAREGNLWILAGDTLGFIYGIYEISRRFLGVEAFWFWNEQCFEKKRAVQIPDDFVYSPVPFRVSFRGWFVNDEVLIHAWQIGRSKEKPWEMVFEALLRCGGNVVIPGTDKNSKIYCHMALDMGLAVTHHHAEPLGAEMFSRRYPGLLPSYDKYPELFEGLWDEAVQSQTGQKIVWNLGFRGQGDCPFWSSDDRYQTDEERGRLLSCLIRKQYDMVKRADAKAVCCTNLYGEIMELWQKGCLDLPEDIIKIWADNGYGKMVSRRQDNHNPRIPALPEQGGDGKGRHGIYYHASFYDLQAASHITMFPNSMDFVRRELLQALDAGADDFWIINCSNVKPHTYMLDFIAAMWRDGSTDVSGHRREYVRRYYGPGSEGVEDCLKAYAECAPAYGDHEDEHAGEQFVNYTTRILASQWMKNADKAAGELGWAVDAESLEEQFAWFMRLCSDAGKSYHRYLEDCRKVRTALLGHAGELFEHTLLLQAKIYSYCYDGGLFLCKAFFEAEEGNDAKAFYYAGRARDSFASADKSMRDVEYGTWHGFYANDCLCDIKQSAWVLEMLMGYLRNLGDGPYFYSWQREFLYQEADRKVCLITNMENHLQNQELYMLMRQRWG